MRRLIICAAVLSFGTSVPLGAHPVHLRFETRGESERAKAAVNNYDREFVAKPIFNIENNGEAQVFFLESFRCEYDEAEGTWRMVNHMGDPSGIGRAWDD